MTKPQNLPTSLRAIDRLLEVMATLRDPQIGCPWDCEQTMHSIVPYTIEETYEVAEAIHHGQPDEIKEELGDLLFQTVFYARLAEEQGWFNFADIAQTMVDKLIRRHPHVFSDQSALSADEVAAQWQAIKRAEKAARGMSAKAASIFADIPVDLPVLMRAEKIQKKAAKQGFDWPELAPVIDKIKEELDEITEARAHFGPAEIEEEVGDLLFAVVNMARHLNVQTDMALFKANEKFMQRYQAMQALAEEQGEKFEALELAQQETLWQTVKEKNKKKAD